MTTPVIESPTEEIYLANIPFFFFFPSKCTETAVKNTSETQQQTT